VELKTKKHSKVDPKKIFNLIFFVLVVALAIFVVPWKSTWSALINARFGYLLVVLGLAIPSFFISALSYKIILDAQGAKIPFWRQLLINLTISFYDIVLPSTFFVSGLRWVKYSQLSRKPGETFVSIAFYKFLNLSLALIISLVLILTSDTGNLKTHAWEYSLILLGIVLVMLIVPVICRWILKRFPESLRIPDRFLIFTVIRNYFYKIVKAFADFQKIKLVSQVILICLGITSQLVMVISYFFMAKSVAVNLSYAQLGTLRAVLFIIINLPVNFGIGVNVKDVTLATALTAMGIPLDKAVAISIISLAKSLIVGIVGGLVELITVLEHKKETTNANVDHLITDI
jgi:uncharacterized membrane protein YbhN (UPF0104 family)